MDKRTAERYAAALVAAGILADGQASGKAARCTGAQAIVGHWPESHALATPAVLVGKGTPGEHMAGGQPVKRPAHIGCEHVAGALLVAGQWTEGAIRACHHHGEAERSVTLRVRGSIERQRCDLDHAHGVYVYARSRGVYAAPDSGCNADGWIETTSPDTFETIALAVDPVPDAADVEAACALYLGEPATPKRRAAVKRCPHGCAECQAIEAAREAVAA